VKLQKLYELIIQEGMRKDPRGIAAVKAVCIDEKKRYEKLEGNDKDTFDKDRLINPFADTRILYGTPGVTVKNVIVGIDMEVGEMLLVDRLRQKGTKIDLIITHHPDGHAYPTFYEVMALQADVFSKYGVAISVAESLTKERMGEVKRSVSSANHMRSVDAARLLDIPFMCVHTPADNHVAAYLQQLFNGKKTKTLKDIVDILHTIPEYQISSKQNAAPFILNGSSSSRAGKILVDMTGGTEGSRDIFTQLVNNGVSTLVCMHLSEGHLKKVKEANINVVMGGHISSDNVGLNLILDEIVKKEPLTFIEASGFRRVQRPRKK
jgi:putative NIF3 family GTP cyclohydrolase 1 type 2